MTPKVCVNGCDVVRVGETANEFFMIQKGFSFWHFNFATTYIGSVEVIATDNQTILAILEEGAYFGEIGLLITGCRSVTVRARTNCIFQVLEKEKFFLIMKMFPEQKELLLKVFLFFNRFSCHFLHLILCLLQFKLIKKQKKKIFIEAIF